VIASHKASKDEMELNYQEKIMKKEKKSGYAGSGALPTSNKEMGPHWL